MHRAFAILIVAIAVPAGAVEKAKSNVEVRERINRAWDEGLRKIWFRQIEAQCKADAKKQYSALRFNKRRTYVEQCIAAKATTSERTQSSHQPN